MEVSDILVSIDDPLEVDALILCPLFEHRKNLGWMCRVNDEGVLGFVVNHPRLISDPPRCPSGVRAAPQISVIVAGPSPYVQSVMTMR